MRLIKPHFEIWEQESGIQGIYKAIERAGRICYRSEDKITEDSAQPFVDRLVKNGHGAMLEHGTVYLAMPMETIIPIEANGWGKYTKNPYSKGFKICEVNGQERVAVTTNLRVLVENGWLDDLKYLCEPTEFHEKRVCVHFTSDIGTLREFFRHRTMSMAQESTRYCNYNKGKFNRELTFVIPPWVDIEPGYYYLPDGGIGYILKFDSPQTEIDENSLEDSNILKYECSDRISESYKSVMAYLYDVEEEYRLMTNPIADNHEQMLWDCSKGWGWQAQQVRMILPLCTKSEAVMTGFTSDWEHFFRLRCSFLAETGAPHPQASELADPLYREFLSRGLTAELNKLK